MLELGFLTPSSGFFSLQQWDTQRIPKALVSPSLCNLHEGAGIFTWFAPCCNLSAYNSARHRAGTRYILEWKKRMSIETRHYSSRVGFWISPQSPTPAQSPSHAPFAPPATRRHCRKRPHLAGSGGRLGPATPSLVEGRGARSRKCRSRGSPGSRPRRCL